MLLGILKESAPGETRVSLLPESLKALLAQGVAITVESGAGLAAGASDDAYTEAGATVTFDRASMLSTADLLPVVNTPGAGDQALLKSGAILIGFLRPLDAPEALATAIARPVTLFSMELIPRISRAQSMDALSSMATVAGYKAVIAAAGRLPRLFPMLMTAAGTIPPARVFVIGAGVAGLQAIATARRLGAVVEAYDVRAAAGEQVRSLGAKFLDVDLGGISDEGGGGYAAELTEEALDRGRDLITRTAAHSDVIVTTAQVPGRPAPRLIRRAAIEAMRPGSVLVDLAAPAGGNCELTQPGITQTHRRRHAAGAAQSARRSSGPRQPALRAQHSQLPRADREEGRTRHRSGRRSPGRRMCCPQRQPRESARRQVAGTSASLVCY